MGEKREKTAVKLTMPSIERYYVGDMMVTRQSGLIFSLDVIACVVAKQAHAMLQACELSEGSKVKWADILESASTVQNEPVPALKMCKISYLCHWIEEAHMQGAKF